MGGDGGAEAMLRVLIIAVPGLLERGGETD
jgi:hypothetical protein